MIFKPKNTEELKIKKKYGAISKLFLRGPDENRAIIQLDELGGE